MSRFPGLWPTLSALLTLTQQYIATHWHVWFDDFKWKHFFSFEASIYGGALLMAGQINVPPAHRHTLATSFVIVAGIMYVLNPKTRSWELPRHNSSRSEAALSCERDGAGDVVPDPAPTIPVDPGVNPFGDGKGGDI